MTENTTLHHVGYTVADIAATARLFAINGYQQGEVLYEENLQVELCYLTKPGSPTIELVHQLNTESLEAELLAAEGVMPYHLCFEAADFEAECRRMQLLGYKPLFTPVPVGVLGGKRICYFEHPDVGYIELLEK